MHRPDPLLRPGPAPDLVLEVDTTGRIVSARAPGTAAGPPGIAGRLSDLLREPGDTPVVDAILAGDTRLAGRPLWVRATVGDGTVPAELLVPDPAGDPRVVHLRTTTAALTWGIPDASSPTVLAERLAELATGDGFTVAVLWAPGSAAGDDLRPLAVWSAPGTGDVDLTGRADPGDGPLMTVSRTGTPRIPGPGDLAVLGRAEVWEEAGLPVVVWLPVGTASRMVVELAGPPTARPTLWRAAELALEAPLWSAWAARERLEQDVRRERTRLQLAVEAGGIGVWDWDARTGRVRWSERLEAMYGLEPGTFGGSLEEYLTLVHPEDRDLARDAAYASLRGDRHAIVHRIIRPDGEVRWVEGRAAVVRDAAGDAAGLLGVAMDVTALKRAEERSRREARLLSTIHRITGHLVATTGLRPMLRGVLESLTGLTGADTAVAVVRSERSGHAAVDHIVVGSEATVADVDWGRVLDRYRPVAGELSVVPGADTSGLLELDGLGGPCAAAPLYRGGRVDGMLLLHRAARRFSRDELRILGEVAAMVSLAVPAAERYEQHRSAAVALQRRLVPSRRVELAGWEACVEFEPAATGVRVGGDWCDLLESGGGLVVVVGDVCGHGIDAAARMAELRFSIGALVEAGLPTDRVLSQANRRCRETLRTTATVAVVELDPSGEGRAWVCGHPPPLVVGPGGVRWVDDDAARAPMLGLMADPAFTSSPVRLSPEDVLVAYTDGLVEGRGRRLDDGLVRLAERVLRRPDGPLQPWCRDLLSEMLAEAPETDDDAIVIAVRRSGA